MFRRSFITGSIALMFAVGACAIAGDTTSEQKPSRADAVVKPAAEWKTQLTPEQFHILREKGTERAFTSPFNDNHKDGVYVCAACGLELYSADHKFDSGSGWPSYFQPIAEDRVDRFSDLAFGMMRTEITCARCGGHLGHVFKDGPAPTGDRHCVNGASLVFEPAKQQKPSKK